MGIAHMEEARQKLYEFILHKIGPDVEFTYEDLPPIRELSEEFYKEYSGLYGAAEASPMIMLSSMNKMALGELLQGLRSVKVVGCETFVMTIRQEVEWLDQEGKILGFTDVEKNTKISTLLENHLKIFHLPRKTSEGREIEYLLQTRDGKCLDTSETLLKNLQEQRIDSLILGLKIVPRAELKEVISAPQIVPASPTPGAPAGRKYCMDCGAEMPLEGEYCPKCGKKQA